MLVVGLAFAAGTEVEVGGSAAVTGELPDHRLHRRQTGAAGHHQQRPLRVGVQCHPPERWSQTERLAGPGGADQGGGHRSAGDQPGVQLDLAATGGVGRGEPPPFPWSGGGGFHRDRLSGQIGQGLVGPHGEDGDVEGSMIHLDDLGLPVGGFGVRGILCGTGHGAGDEPVRGGPVGGQVVRPGIAAEMPQGGQQRFTDRRVVRGHSAELPVVAPQILQIRHQFVDPVDVGHDPHQRPDQPIALSCHGRREHVPGLRVPQEQVTVEVQGDLVGSVRRDDGEVLLQSSRIDVRHCSLPTPSARRLAATRRARHGWCGPSPLSRCRHGPGSAGGAEGLADGPME